jgi:hypothetical protein
MCRMPHNQTHGAGRTFFAPLGEKFSTNVWLPWTEVKMLLKLLSNRLEPHPISVKIWLSLKARLHDQWNWIVGLIRCLKEFHVPVDFFVNCERKLMLLWRQLMETCFVILVIRLVCCMSAALQTVLTLTVTVGARQLWEIFWLKYFYFVSYFMTCFILNDPVLHV